MAMDWVANIMKYLQHYSESIQQQVSQLIAHKKLGTYLLEKYPHIHEYHTDKALYNYTLAIKNRFMKQSLPLSKVMY
ncbi:MAG TPA: metal-dependent hydrolase, partial [Helicobacteraceae bacterium]|nr:metal-dependent hydrolase [Helicobacteraceae bacterium]